MSPGHDTGGAPPPRPDSNRPHPASSGTVRVVIVDDHLLVRAAIRDLLNRLPGVEVVGEAADGREAIDVVADTAPSVALMDITMPGLSGLLALGRITLEFPTVKVLVLSAHETEEHVLRSLRAGAAGYLNKGASPEELERAIWAVHREGSYISPTIGRHVLTALTRRDLDDALSFALLSPRQLEILQLIAEGYTNQEIAATLGIGLKTVETHRSQLMDRLDIHDVAGLVRFALRSGLVDPER